MEKLTNQGLQDLVQHQILVNELEKCIELEGKCGADSTYTKQCLEDAKKELKALKQKYEVK